MPFLMKQLNDTTSTSLLSSKAVEQVQLMEHAVSKNVTCAIASVMSIFSASLSWRSCQESEHAMYQLFVYMQDIGLKQEG